MSSVFNDHKVFMEACGQTTGKLNDEQLALYAELLHEEGATEFPAAMLDYATDGNVEALAEVIDAAIDTIVVAIGALHSIGIDPQLAWDAVHKTNLAKIEPSTGEVRKSQSGKVLKPVGWKPPTADLIALAESVLNDS